MPTKPLSGVTVFSLSDYELYERASLAYGEGLRRGDSEAEQDRKLARMNLAHLLCLTRTQVAA